MHILLIGLGRWGEKHLRVLRAPVWAADVSAARREWAVRHGLDPRRAFADDRDFLGRGLDDLSLTVVHYGDEPTRRDEPLRLELQAFLDACAGRAANPVPATAGVRALAVVEAATQAARLGATVSL